VGIRGATPGHNGALDQKAIVALDRTLAARGKLTSITNRSGQCTNAIEYIRRAYGGSSMAANPDEIKRREAAARAQIKRAFGTASDEFGATIFVSHHLEELDSSYWKKHLSTENPDPRRVLELLELRSHWGGDDEIDTFDFTLPEQVTNYVLSVMFDESGDISEITMES
jgi:Protein of unknown function (DUF2004)